MGGQLIHRLAPNPIEHLLGLYTNPRAGGPKPRHSRPNKRWRRKHSWQLVGRIAPSTCHRTVDACSRSPRLPHSSANLPLTANCRRHARRISQPHPIRQRALWIPNQNSPRAPNWGPISMVNTALANSHVMARTRAGRRIGRAIDYEHSGFEPG